VDGLIDRPITIRDGYAYPTDAPGWGFSFKDDRLTELASFKR
jgi:L-alanine-DL-glutamate epimerase-like enolase superfamily enzyme